MYPEQLPLVLDRNDWLYEDICEGRYESYRRLYYSSTRALKTPNISDRFNSENAVHTSGKNLRICAELLRAGAWLTPISGLDAPRFLTHVALMENNWPLVSLIIYARGIEPFQNFCSFRETGVQSWRSRHANGTFNHSVQDGYEFLRQVQHQNNLIAVGNMYKSRSDYAAAFSCFDQAARMLLSFDQGDEGLKLFYLEEAAPLFLEALQMLTYIFTCSGEPLYRREPLRAASLPLHDWKLLQKLKLLSYMQELVKIIPPYCEAKPAPCMPNGATVIEPKKLTFRDFEQVYAPYQFISDEIPTECWSRPEFQSYIGLRESYFKIRSRTSSGGSGSSSSSGVGGSSDSLHTT